MNYTTEELLESLQNDLETIKTNLADGGMEIDDDDNFSNISTKTTGIVIGGGGDEKVHYFEDNQIILSEAELGVYMFSPNYTGYNPSEIRTITIKATPNSTAKSIDVNVNTKLYIHQNYTSGVVKYVMADVDVQNYYPYRVYEGIYIILVDAYGNIGVQDNRSYIEPVILNANQTISGTKTFNNIPQCSVTPSANNDLVNKKYVDDAIGGALGGSY